MGSDRKTAVVLWLGVAFVAVAFVAVEVLMAKTSTVNDVEIEGGIMAVFSAVMVLVGRHLWQRNDRRPRR